MKIPTRGIKDIKLLRPFKVSADWSWFATKPILVNAIPKMITATAIAPFWANVITPYSDDSVLMPDFHSPYSMVSGSIDQNNTPVAPLPNPIKAKIYKSS